MCVVLAFSRWVAFNWVAFNSYCFYLTDSLYNCCRVLGRMILASFGRSQNSFMVSSQNFGDTSQKVTSAHKNSLTKIPRWNFRLWSTVATGSFIYPESTVFHTGNPNKLPPLRFQNGRDHLPGVFSSLQCDVSVLVASLEQWFVYHQVSSTMIHPWHYILERPSKKCRSRLFKYHESWKMVETVWRVVIK